MSYVQQLAEKLDHMGARIGGITLGPNPGNAENIAKELLHALEELEKGELEPVLCYDSYILTMRTKMTKEEIEADPDLFKARYREEWRKHGEARNEQKVRRLRDRE